MAYQKKTWTNDISELSAENFNPMEEGIFGAYPVQLIAIDSTAPSTCATGDKYYNTTSKKIFTATGTNTWGTNGETPLEDTAYWLISENGSYAWNGTDLVSIGGGKAEVVISDEEPEEGKIWVNPEEEIPVIAGREHLVQVGTSVDDTYRVNLLSSKNLLKLNIGTQTINGITITKNSDGSYKLNGTASANITIYDYFDMTLKKGTYTHSINNTAPTGLYLSLNNISATMIGTGGNTQKVTFTLTEDTNYTRYVLYVASGTSLDNLIIYPMIEIGSTATTYEPFIQNQIVVDNEKYSDTLNVGVSVDSRSRVNILKGEQLYNSSNVEIGKTWQGNANNNRARLVLPISPNETYNIRVKGSGVAIAVVETTETPTSSSTSNATYTPEINTQLTEKAKSTTTYVILQLDAGTTFTTAILNSLEISIYYGTGSIVVDNEEIYNQNIMNYSTNETRIGTWLGKPLYRKVIDIGALPNNTQKAITHNISNIQTITKVSGYCTNSNIYFPLPNVNTTIDLQIAVYSTKTQVIVNTGTDRSSYSGYVVLEYTKTSD